MKTKTVIVELLIVLLLAVAVSAHTGKACNQDFQRENVNTYVINNKDGFLMNTFILTKDKIDLMQKTKVWQHKTLQESKARHFRKHRLRHPDSVNK